ncbi:MAG TPA: hypothetical protein VMV92_38455 [Streptosporangiaceae bacterium]|nr:hypothetical protein [Streptosporangiaceae bacterium]
MSLQARKFIAVVVPGSGILGRYAPLVVKGIIRVKPTTTRDLDQIPSYTLAGDRAQHTAALVLCYRVRWQGRRGPHPGNAEQAARLLGSAGSRGDPRAHVRQPEVSQVANLRRQDGSCRGRCGQACSTRASTWPHHPRCTG